MPESLSFQMRPFKCLRDEGIRKAARGERQEARGKFSHKKHERGTTGDSQFKTQKVSSV